MQVTDILNRNIEASIAAKREMLTRTEEKEVFSEAVKKVIDCYKNGGRIYIAGNGGSAADSQHLAAEFVSKLARDRAPLPAEALTVDSSILTAIGNDYGYDKVFSRQILGKVSSKDIFLGITTSGNSANIIEALYACKEKNVPSIVFTGHDGGKTKELADFCVIASGVTTASIQELHIVLAHTMCECVEIELFK